MGLNPIKSQQRSLPWSEEHTSLGVQSLAVIKTSDGAGADPKMDPVHRAFRYSEARTGVCYLCVSVSERRAEYLRVTNASRMK